MGFGIDEGQCALLLQDRCDKVIEATRFNQAVWSRSGDSTDPEIIETTLKLPEIETKIINRDFPEEIRDMDITLYRFPVSGDNNSPTYQIRFNDKFLLEDKTYAPLTKFGRHMFGDEQ